MNVNDLAVLIPKCNGALLPVLQAEIGAYRYFSEALPEAFAWSAKESSGNGVQFVLGKAG